MRSIACAIWFLSALLVVTALDAFPDPPAVNPPNNVCKVFLLDAQMIDSAALCSSFAWTNPLPLGCIASEVEAPDLPTNRIILTGQISDSSPPSTLSL